MSCGQMFSLVAEVAVAYAASHCIIANNEAKQARLLAQLHSVVKESNALKLHCQPKKLSEVLEETEVSTARYKPLEETLPHGEFCIGLDCLVRGDSEQNQTVATLCQALEVSAQLTEESGAAAQSANRSCRLRLVLRQLDLQELGLTSILQLLRKIDKSALQVRIGLSGGWLCHARMTLCYRVLDLVSPA